ncbi:DUF4928 family protein [Candidatus Poriferisocius sp.]|uniref:DUF4928 family protein n=1 Tax=Candidatus Poriferisocius sp. TaxID=3101276 RepID=UPI003B012C5F
MNAESIADVLDADIEQWYEAQRNDGTVNRNVMAVGLIMCEHMSSHFPLDEDKWLFAWKRGLGCLWGSATG